jgi:hypothetical protein
MWNKRRKRRKRLNKSGEALVTGCRGEDARGREEGAVPGRPAGNLYPEAGRFYTPGKGR